MKKALVIILVGLLLSGCAVTGSLVDVGDTVTVNYIGKLEDGTVFDTNIQEVAENPVYIKGPSFAPHRVYTPLKFTVGKGTVIQGFEEGVIGMKEGEEREVLIPPEKGYGEWKEELVDIRPRVFKVPVVEEVPIREITEKTGLAEFEKNTTIDWRGWKARVLLVAPDSIVLRNLVESSKVNTETGTLEIAVDENWITQEFTPISGSSVQTEIGRAKIGIINDSHFKMDFNHPLAGKTLVFDITVVSIEKAGK